MSTLGLKVRELRISRELNQEQAAVAVGLSVGAWRGIENYSADPRLSTLQRLAAFFGVGYDLLVSDPARLSAPDIRKEIKHVVKLVEEGVPGAPKALEQLQAELRRQEGGSGPLARERTRSAQLELQAPRRAGARSAR